METTEDRIPLKRPDFLNVAARVPVTEAEGPGRRFALWLQGCPLRCPGCCNPHMLEAKEVEWVPVEEMISEILSSPEIEGITVIGGEPFGQAEALAKVCKALREQGLSVMIFSGFTLKTLRSRNREDWNALLEEVDLLVDGPYIQAQHVTDRRWIGSANQKVRFLTDRYAHLEESETGWDEGRNTIELRMTGNKITINGFPHPELTEKLASLSLKRVK
jgi:anaerobic ribonucleoside-triphosphate reductase activating protein